LEQPLHSLFKFHKLTSAVDSHDSYVGLTAIHKELLMLIGKAHYAKQPLTVSDVLALTKLASPATLHGRLKELRNWGFVEIVTGADNRFKFLKPSALANDYFNAVARCLKKAAQAS
jgi:hypothetical protein